VKIAMIGQKGFPATYGGIERHVEEVAVRLVERGHTVSVYCRHDYTPARGPHRGVRRIHQPSLNTKHLGTATHVVASVADSVFRDFDLVHFHALGPSLFSWVPRLAGRRSVVTVHGLDWQREKWGPAASWLLKRCETAAVRFPDRTIVVSQTLQRYFRERHRRETVYVPNGTTLPPLGRSGDVRRFGLEPGRYVLFVGRLVPEKGVHYLLDAYRKVRTELPLAIAGGYAFAPEYQEQLQARASERVRFLGYVFGEALDDLWANAHFVVLPSTLEGLSIALLEALSHGRCALVSDIPENLEVADGCAPVFRSRDVEDLRARLQDLLDHPERVREYEGMARRRIEERFSWDRVVDRLEAVYQEVLGSRGGAGG
jgi:glycosyltransferase involved in cell wall biosynthesis